MNRILLPSLAALTAACVLPMAAAAQQSAPDPAPPSAGPIMTAFRTSSARYVARLTAAFDSIPASKYGYKPTPAQQSIGYVAQHLEFGAYALCERFGGLHPPAAFADSAIADTVRAMWPKDTLVARMKVAFAFCDGAMAGLTDAKLAEELPSEGTPGHRPTRATGVVIYLTDLADHYSQIANYMRLNGMLPPSAQPRPKT
jgi:hypothetical protein